MKHSFVSSVVPYISQILQVLKFNCDQRESILHLIDRLELSSDSVEYKRLTQEASTSKLLTSLLEMCLVNADRHFKIKNCAEFVDSLSLLIISRLNCWDLERATNVVIYFLVDPFFPT